MEQANGPEQGGVTGVGNEVSNVNIEEGHLLSILAI